MNGIERMQIEGNQSYLNNPLDRTLDPNSKEDRSIDHENDRLEFSKTYQTFIQQSIQMDPHPSAAVQEARRALENGDLDNPHAARLAAESLLKFGI